MSESPLPLKTRIHSIPRWQLRAARAILRVSQEALGDRLGLNPRTIRIVENADDDAGYMVGIEQKGVVHLVHFYNKSGVTFYPEHLSFKPPPPTEKAPIP